MSRSTSASCRHQPTSPNASRTQVWVWHSKECVILLNYCLPPHRCHHHPCGAGVDTGRAEGSHSQWGWGCEWSVWCGRGCMGCQSLPCMLSSRQCSGLVFQQCWYLHVVATAPPSTQHSSSDGCISPQLLEAALRAHPSLDPQRWDKIANAVPSRTRRECLARFKVSGELRHACAVPPCGECCSCCRSWWTEQGHD